MLFLRKILFRFSSLLTYISQVKRSNKINDPQIRELLNAALKGSNAHTPINKIENIRKALLKNPEKISRTDFGAGSRAIQIKNRTVASIARSSLSNKRQCLFLYHLAQKSESKKVMELGTSFGISTAYLAKSHPETQVYTLEGDPEISRLAQNHFSLLDLDKIQLITGDFDLTLPAILHKNPDFDFAYLDGNHTYSATLKYYHHLKTSLSPKAVVILDDIYWSKGMKKAWNAIQESDSHSTFINLYFFGIIFRNSEKPQKVKIWPGWSWLLGI